MVRALLVIDVQNEYFPGGALPLHRAEEAEARIAASIGKAVAAGDKVVLVRHVAQASSGPFAADGDGIAIRPAIRQAAGDAPVVTKHFADAFQETDLAAHLRGVDRLLIGGMMTQNCVVFTALSRAADEFGVAVVEDLCAAPSELVHQIALTALRSKRPGFQSAELWA